MKKTTLLLIGLLFAGVFILISAQAEMKTEMPVSHDGLEVATFAGGCFWCTESDFEKLDGVVKVISGYTGGTEKNPTYRRVASGKTRHLESVKVYYDPAKISYEQLLGAFWKMVNPTDDGGQFVDRGYQYSTAIFYHTDAQRRAAETSKSALNESGRYEENIVTPIREAGLFYAAENYHQNYYKRNPVRYKYYRWNSGRDQYLAKIWGEETLHN
ncbi:MAG: peptide-methionine (S)-S-oxide reductase MsrA [Candidatus Thiodiazotropha sp. (ex Monitilora ramsayi)]|nr:peptide-methionine (S)-S-oxide reductase MsrA [Candidatus Thiodiazotropha sp. (ex Monitilora ramsayi)]